MCQFEHEGKKIKLLPSGPKVGQPEHTHTTPKKTKRINLINVKAFDQELKRGAPYMILTGREIVEESDSTIPP